jgi:hypothetical protein
VDGEDLVVGLPRQERHLRLGELDADQQREQAAGQEEHKRAAQIQPPDLLVVGRGDPAEQPQAVVVGLGVRGGCGRAHGSPPAWSASHWSNAAGLRACTANVMDVWSRPQ